DLVVMCHGIASEDDDNEDDDVGIMVMWIIKVINFWSNLESRIGHFNLVSELRSSEVGFHDRLPKLRPLVDAFVIASEDDDDEEDDVGIMVTLIKLSSNLKVANMIEDDCWKWPSDWMRKYPDIASIPVPTINPSEVDKVRWKNKKGKFVKFSMRNVLDDLYEDVEQVKCVERNPKSMNVKHFLDSWDDIIQVMGSLKNNNSVWSIVRRISLGATVYFIWNERNSRVFKGEKRKTEDIVVLIEWDGVCSDVKDRLVMRSASVLDGCLEAHILELKRRYLKIAYSDYIRRIQQRRYGVSALGLHKKPRMFKIVGIKRLHDDLEVTAAKVCVTAAK
ncbi:hypothetical protein Tco_0661845, partial [Tanacetum coccineum]